MNKYIKLLCLAFFSFVQVALISGQLSAFSLSMSTNSLRLNGIATVTVDVSPGVPGSYTYEWSATTGIITGTNDIVTFTAPNVKARPVISVTVKSGGAAVYTGSIAVLVYKSIFIIKNDDYDFSLSAGASGKYVRPTWKAYTDYMESTRCKTSVGIECVELDTAATYSVSISSIYFNYLKDMAHRGYVNYYCHGYTHVQFYLYSGAQQLAWLQASELAAQTWLNMDMPGFGSPQNSADTMTVVAMNTVPEMKYYFFPECSRLTKAQASAFNGYCFYSADTRLDAETSAPQHITYSGFLTEYANKGNRPINVIQIHPPWWQNNGPTYWDLREWDRVIQYLREHGNTMLAPMDVVLMISTPTFVPMEDPNAMGADTSSPTAPGTVRDGTGASDSAFGSTTTLSANWTAATDDTGVAKYWYAIGTAAGATNTKAWADNGASLSVTWTASPVLPEGTTYYFTVKAQDGAGNTGLTANSNGQVTPRGVISGGGGGGTTINLPFGKAYPNPCSLSNTSVKFQLDSGGGEVSIYTLSGRLIKALTVNAGTAVASWNFKNNDGEKIKPGVYVYTAKDNNGIITTGRVVFK